MKRWAGPLAVLLLSAASAHALTLHFAPNVIMDRAMAALAERGVALHAFTTPQRVTPQTQSVVRSSPDLYYALCRYDLTRPEGYDAHVSPILNVQMMPWSNYQSLSFFDARTNNFATIRGDGRAVRVSLSANGSEVGPVLESADRTGRNFRLSAPTARGVILIRRLAPSPEAFEQAVKASMGDLCSFGMRSFRVY